MKKYLLLLLLTLSIFVNAQKVERDYYEGNMHKVETEWEEMEDNKDKRDFFVMLLGTKTPTDKYYFLMFQPYSYGNFTFDVGSKLLMKTFDDTVYTKECTGATPTKKQFVQIFMVPATRYFATVSYLVSEEELNSFINNGIKKLRFQVTGETFEYEYKKDKIGKYLKKAKENIDSALEKQTSFDADF